MLRQQLLDHYGTGSRLRALKRRRDWLLSAMAFALADRDVMLSPAFAAAMPDDPAPITHAFGSSSIAVFALIEMPRA